MSDCKDFQKNRKNPKGKLKNENISKLKIPHVNSTSQIRTSIGWPLLIISLLTIGTTTACFAVPGDIPVMKTLLEKLVPYLGFAFTAGGVYYSGMNGKQVVTGDYRAAPRLLVSIGAAGLGLAGIFGTDALTVTVP